MSSHRVEISLDLEEWVLLRKLAILRGERMLRFNFGHEGLTIVARSVATIDGDDEDDETWKYQIDPRDDAPAFLEAVSKSSRCGKVSPEDLSFEHVLRIATIATSIYTFNRLDKIVVMEAMADVEIAKRAAEAKEATKE